MEENLLPCKCGKKPWLVICGVGSYVRCPWCDTATYMQTTAKDAVRLWDKMAGRNMWQKEGMLLPERQLNIFDFMEG